MSEEISLNFGGVSLTIKRRVGPELLPTSASDASAPARSLSASSFELVEGYSSSSLPVPLPSAESHLQASGPLPASLDCPASARSGSSQRPARRSILASSHPREPEYPLRSPAGSGESRASVRASFPPFTTQVRDICRHLRGGEIAWEVRALRAWTCGCWARAILDGRASKPDPAQPLVGLANRFYCVVRADGLDCPVVVRSFQAYKAIVGDLPSGHSISQAFPSEAEARVYFEGARLSFPQF